MAVYPIASIVRAASMIRDRGEPVTIPKLARQMNVADAKSLRAFIHVIEGLKEDIQIEKTLLAKEEYQLAARALVDAELLVTRRRVALMCKSS